MMFTPNSLSPGGSILVIGAATVDTVGLLRAELQIETDTPALIRSSYGGVARNVAENLARLGERVNFITVVGEDEAGERLLDALADAGVNIDAVLHASERTTGAYLAVVDQAGSLRYALIDLRAIEALTPAYIKQHEYLFRDASILFVDANIPKKALRTVMSLAQKANLPVCADPTATPLADRLIPYLDRLFLITPNGAEASIFCDPDRKINSQREALDAAKHLVGQGVDIAIITMAEQGLCYATSETNGYIPAIRTEIIDPTGAGDALSSTVIFALLNVIPLDEAVRLGVSAASLTLGHPGAVVPDLTLETLYDQLVI